MTSENALDEALAQQLMTQRTLLLGDLARHTGRTADRVREDTDRDLVLTAEAAVDYSLVDVVLAPRRVEPVDA